VGAAGRSNLGIKRGVKDWFMREVAGWRSLVKTHRLQGHWKA